MQMVSDTKSHEQYWDCYENTTSGQRTFFGGHSVDTQSLDNLPNGKLLNLKNGSICITSDGCGYIWDRIKEEWVEQ